MIYGNKFHGYGIINENFYTDYGKEVRYISQDYNNDIKIGKDYLKEKNFSKAEERFNHALKLIDDMERVFEKCLSKYPDIHPSSSAYNFDNKRNYVKTLISKCNG